MIETSFTPRRVEKPWGYELIWAVAEEYVGKVLFVRAGQALSLQYHERKDESWLVQSGRATLELGEVGGVLEAAEIGAGCEIRNLAVVGPGATLGSANELDHGLRIGAGQRIPEQALRFS